MDIVAHRGLTTVAASAYWAVMKRPSYDLIVIGGGPAGMMTAGTAASNGASVLLLEKNPGLGRKLLLSGGKRCNFTNTEPDLHRLCSLYGEAGKALLSPFSRMPPRDVLDFFASRGMPYKIEDNQRAFPQSNKSRSVLQVLQEYMQQSGVELYTNTTVDAVRIKHGAVHGVRIGKEPIAAAAVAIATGGLARPDTGSTGDGFCWLERSGHTIIRPEPSLVPVVVEEPWVQDLQGLAFPDVRIRVIAGEKTVHKSDGKILFTHFGLSGPGILNLATSIAQTAGSQSQSKTIISLNFFPTEDGGAVDRRLQQLFQEQPRRKLSNSLDTLLPPRLVQRIIAAAASHTPEAGSMICSSVPKQLRKRLAELLQDFRLTFRELQSEDWAVVSSGGVPIDEVDFRTMQSKLVDGLYIVGDMLNINRPSGGYSLQICWATGYAAGIGAASQRMSS